MASARCNVLDAETEKRAAHASRLHDTACTPTQCVGPLASLCESAATWRGALYYCMKFCADKTAPQSCELAPCLTALLQFERVAASAATAASSQARIATAAATRAQALLK